MIAISITADGNNVQISGTQNNGGAVTDLKQEQILAFMLDVTKMFVLTKSEAKSNIVLAHA